MGSLCLYICMLLWACTGDRTFNIFFANINFAGKMRILWNKKNILYICLVACFLYLILRPKKHNVKFEIFIDKTKPVHVWEYVADFSNMKTLNPLLLDFNILSETGNYNHWEYRAEYTEFLHQFPQLKNYNRGHFVVKPTGNDDYSIISNHQTCMFSKIMCLESTSDFRCTSTPIGKISGTTCVDNITYECPVLFSSFCRNEITFQRSNIMVNLKKQFT